MANAATTDRSPAPAAGLQICSLSKTFPGTLALDDVSFGVPRGTIHALLGGNGSGKSTLIKVLAGVETGDPGGTISFGEFEAPSDQITPAWADSARLRFVHQDLGLFENLSVAENIYAGQRPPRRRGRIDWRGMRRGAQGVLDRLEIRIRAADGLASVAPADRTLVAIARAVPAVDDLAGTLLVLDEPTARLAAAETRKLLVALQRYAKHGQTILFVSHRLDEVFEVADSATILRDGRWVHTGAIGELDEPAIVGHMVGEPPDRERARSDEAVPQAREPGDTVLRIEGLAGGPLKGVALAVSAGEILGVAGLVGSGRSEILESIFGARPYSRGTIELGGKRLLPGRIGEAIRHGVSLVPEDRGAEGVFANLGIPENLSASDSHRYASGMIFRHARERRDAAATIERMGIRAASVTATVNSLSGGNQQKVVLGRWLAMEPRLLLLDEPTQGVDVAARHDLHRQIEAVAACGCAVLLVSSDLEELLELPDRVVVLAGGRIVAQADRSELDHAWLGTHMYASIQEGAVA
jgi:ribose transport system ATP-binding protein